MTRTYSELSELPTFLERFEYLVVHGEVGCATFGFHRLINQRFYTSNAWRRARRDAIVRDLGCDLGVEGYEIHDRIIVHHMNPLDERDIVEMTENALSLEFLITTTHDTHNSIHYGDAAQLAKPYSPRSPGDTKLW